jgi:hypothetical protein
MGPFSRHAADDQSQNRQNHRANDADENDCHTQDDCSRREGLGRDSPSLRVLRPWKDTANARKDANQYVSVTDMKIEKEISDLLQFRFVVSGPVADSMKEPN